jgi:hypothetical protein
LLADGIGCCIRMVVRRNAEQPADDHPQHCQAARGLDNK